MNERLLTAEVSPNVACGRGGVVEKDLLIVARGVMVVVVTGTGLVAGVTGTGG